MGVNMTLVWPDTWLAQNAAVASLLNRIEVVDREVSPATYINSAEPADDDDLESAWILKKGAGSQIPEGSKTHWFNPATGRIENIFVKVGEISPFGQPLIGRQQTSGMTLIDSLFVTAALGAQASKTFTISANYESIHFIGQLRSSTASASSSLLLRYNASAAAVYNTLIHRAITAATFDRVTLVNQTSIFTTNLLIPAAAGNTPKNVYTSFKFDCYFPSRKSHMFGMWAAYVDDGGASEQQVATFANSATSIAAITSVVFSMAAGSIDLGSWIACYGINPVT
jgi:hypothetical protein